MLSQPSIVSASVLLRRYFPICSYFVKAALRKFTKSERVGTVLDVRPGTRKKVARVNMHVTGHSEKFNFCNGLDVEILLVHRTVLVLGCRNCITFKSGEGGFQNLTL